MPMDKIINILLLTIIFVFDPLAIALVIAANFAFERLKPKKEEDDGFWTEEEMQDFNEQFNADDLLHDEDEIEESEDWEELNEDLFGKEDEEAPNEDLKSAAEKYNETINKLDVDGDNKITERDLHAAQLKLTNPNLPDYKRSYWENIVRQLKKKLDNDDENTITYN